MDSSWMEVKEEEDLEPFRFEGLRVKTRFSFAEIKLLLEEVKNNRFVVLKKFNAGVSSDMKKQIWSDITDKVNSLGVTVRETRQIMKKWADLKCDARRRMLAMRAPKGHKKTLGPVEVMVQKILLMAPGKDEAELDLSSIEEISRRRQRAKPRGRPRRQPLSSSKKESAEDYYRSSPEITFDLIDDETMPIDFEEQDQKPLLESKHPYSSSSSYTPYPPPPAPPYPSSSNGASSFHASPSSSSSIMPPPLLPPPPPVRHAPPPSSSAPPPPPAPPPSYSPGGSAQERLARVAAQSLQQQQAGAALLGSVSRSLELLAQAVQQLVETQQDFIQESLNQQRHTLDILKDFSHNAIALLRDRPSGQAKTHPAQPPLASPGTPPAPTTTGTRPPPDPRPAPGPHPAPGPELPHGPEQHNIQQQRNETQKVELLQSRLDSSEPQEPELGALESREPEVLDPEFQTLKPQPMEVQEPQPETPGEPTPESSDPDKATNMANTLQPITDLSLPGPSNPGPDQ